MVENTIPLINKIVVGGCVLALQTIGVDAGPLFWAIVGASLGMSFARPASRVRAAVVFVAVVLACGLFGTWLAQAYLTDSDLNRNALSCLIAMLFHLLWNAVAERAAALADVVIEAATAFVRRWLPGGKS